MATDEHTIAYLENLLEKLRVLGVKSSELKMLKDHIREQKRQINIYPKNQYVKDTSKKLDAQTQKLRTV